MKRWISLLLTLALVFTLAPGSLLPALGEEIEEEITGEAADAALPLAEEPGAEDLVVEIGEWEEIDAQATETAPAFAARYGHANAGVELSAAPGEAPFAALLSGGAALILEDDGEWPRVAFNADSGIVTGYVAASALTPLDDVAVAALMDGFAATGAAFYDGNPDLPLAAVAIAPIQAQPETAGEAEDAAAAPEAVTETEAAADETAAAPETEDTANQTAAIAEVAEIAALSNASEDAAGNAVEDETYFANVSSVFDLESRSADVVVGDTYVIEAVASNGASIDASELAFASSDDAVATVDESGVVTANQAGSADISVTYRGEVLRNAIHVPEEPDSIKLNAASGAIGLAETYSQLNVIMLPEGTDASVTWRSSNTKYVKVDAKTGAIKGVKKGSAYVYAKTRNNKEARCKVTVKKAPSKVTVSKTLTVGVEQTKKLSASLPSGSASGTITWSSSNKDVATVDESGNVTGVAPGTAKVNARAFNGKNMSCTVTVKPLPEAIALNRTSANMIVKGTLTVSGTLSPAGAMAANTFKSSDTGVATVTSAGKVTAKKIGTATITVTTYNGLSAECEIHVMKNPSKVTLSKTSATLGVNMTYALTPTVSPADADPDVSWSSSNSKVAKVSGGVVTAVKTGSATITAKTANGKKATCKITVKAKPTSIALSPAAVRLGADGMRFQLNKTIKPSGAVAGTIIYESSDESVATVSESGLITTGVPGEAVITATAADYDGISAVCAVTVTPKPVKASFDTTEIEISAKQTYTPSVTVLAADGSEAVTSLTFQAVSNAGCVSVNSNTGAITGVKAGTATVKVSTHNDVEPDKLLTVTVLPAPTGISLNTSTGYLGVGETYEALKATLKGPAGCASELTWSSSNTKVLTVKAGEDNGSVLTAKATGTATVTVKTHNGYKATCKVTVKKAPTSVSIKASAASVDIGKDVAFTVTRSSGSVGCYSLKSSDEKVLARVSDTKFTAVAPGTATVTVTTYNNKSASVKVTVKAPSVTLSASAATAYVGSTVTVTPSYSSSFITECSLASSNSAVLSKTGDNTFAAVAAGTATVTCTTNFGNQASVNITVRETGGGLTAADAAKIEAVIKRAESQLGKPYVYGGGYTTKTPSGFDCSGFTYWSYYWETGIKLGNSAYKQGNDSKYTKITKLADLRRGDILCFKDDSSSTISHVGLYLGNSTFIHASSSSKKVIYSYFNKGNSAAYWTRNLRWGYHVIGG